MTTTELPQQVEGLPALLDKARTKLERAKDAAEVLEAHSQAKIAHDTAAHLERFARAQKAHEALIETCRQMQIDALDIRVRAECRIADEYDAAQERGEVQKQGGDRKSKINLSNEKVDPTVNDIGLTYTQVHAARQLRDVEKLKPGKLREAWQAQLKARDRLTLAAALRAVMSKPAPQPDSRAPMSKPQPPAPEAPAKPDAAKPATNPLTEELAQARTRIATLEKELAAATARIHELVAQLSHERERQAAELAAAKGRIHELLQQEAKRKAEKPPLPPDEVRDKRIKSLTTANKNLRTELFILEQHYNEAMAKAGAMSFTTRGTIHKGLQPESSGEARDAARKAFNGFCDDQKRAGPTKRHS